MKILLLTAAILLSTISSAQNIGIGNSNPSEKLHVSGNIRADTAKVVALKIPVNAAAGKVLTSDANGNAIWQNGSSGTAKVYNGLTNANDTFNIGGTIYTPTSLSLNEKYLSINDVGPSGMMVALSNPAGSTVSLNNNPVTQTFVAVASGLVNQVRINISAVNGGSITLELKNAEGATLASLTKTFATSSNGLNDFNINAYVEKNKTYTLRITGNANAFINYDASANAYPQGISSLGANADIGFMVVGLEEEALAIFKNNKVGIGTSNPTEKLEVVGGIKSTALTTGSVTTGALQISGNGAGVGKVLVSNETGSGSWVAMNSLPGAVNKTGNFSGSAGLIPVAGNTWEMFGSTPSVTVNGNQRIIINITAALGRNGSMASIQPFYLDFGYIPQGSTTVVSGSSGYIIHSPGFPAGSARYSFTISGSMKLPAGTYKIGGMVMCAIPQFLNYNDFISGYYMIVNE